MYNGRPVGHFLTWSDETVTSLTHKTFLMVTDCHYTIVNRDYHGLYLLSNETIPTVSI